MEPILLYGHPLGSSLGLVTALEWLGQPYRLSRVRMPEDMLTDNYARLNARQETPVLITGQGQVVTETMAIVRALELLDVERRISFATESAEAHLMHQFIGVLNTGFTAAFSPYWAAFEMAQPDPDYQVALRRFGRAQVNNRHRKLEAMMGDTPYLLGERPTLADAVFIGVSRWADFHKAIEPADYPRIDALKQRLAADPAVRRAIAIENGEVSAGHVKLEEVLSQFAA